MRLSFPSSNGNDITGKVYADTSLIGSVKVADGILHGLWSILAGGACFYASLSPDKHSKFFEKARYRGELILRFWGNDLYDLGYDIPTPVNYSPVYLGRGE